MIDRARPKVQLVVPCYNEGERLPAEAFVSFARANAGFCFIFVDDGSEDDTATLLRQIQEQIPDAVSLVKLARNEGKGEAVRAGISKAIEKGGSYWGYWDADLSTPLEECHTFVEALEATRRAVLTTGARVALLGRHIERSPWRHYLGRLFATVASSAFSLPMYDTQCGAKLFRASDAVAALFEQRFLTRWLFDLEILLRMKSSADATLRAEEAILEIPLTHWRDVAGSKIRPSHFPLVLYDLARIAAHYK